jgi:hypothetical protein
MTIPHTGSASAIISFAALAVAATTLLVGCKSPDPNDYLPGVVPPSGNTMTTPELSGLGLDRHVMIDSSLTDSLEVVEVKVQPEAASAAGEPKPNPLSFSASIRNVRTGFWSWLVGDSPYEIAYRTYWFIPADASNPPSPQPWILKPITPGETFEITGAAPDPECRSFAIHVIPVREGSAFHRQLTGAVPPLEPKKQHAEAKAPVAPPVESVPQSDAAKAPATEPAKPQAETDYLSKSPEPAKTTSDAKTSPAEPVTRFVPAEEVIADKAPKVDRDADARDNEAKEIERRKALIEAVDKKLEQGKKNLDP